MEKTEIKTGYIRVNCPTCLGGGKLRKTAYVSSICYACSGLRTVLIINQQIKLK